MLESINPITATQLSGTGSELLVVNNSDATVTVIVSNLNGFVQIFNYNPADNFLSSQQTISAQGSASSVSVLELQSGMRILAISENDQGASFHLQSSPTAMFTQVGGQYTNSPAPFINSIACIESNPDITIRCFAASAQSGGINPGIAVFDLDLVAENFTPIMQVNETAFIPEVTAVSDLLITYTTVQGGNGFASELVLFDPTLLQREQSFEQTGTVFQEFHCFSDAEMTNCLIADFNNGVTQIGFNPSNLATGASIITIPTDNQITDVFQGSNITFFFQGGQIPALVFQTDNLNNPLLNINVTANTGVIAGPLLFTLTGDILSVLQLVFEQMQTSESSLDDNGGDNLATIIGIALGIGLPVSCVVIFALAACVYFGIRLHRSENLSHSESGPQSVLIEFDDNDYENLEKLVNFLYINKPQSEISETIKDELNRLGVDVSRLKDNCNIESGAFGTVHPCKYVPPSHLKENYKQAPLEFQYFAIKKVSNSTDKVKVIFEGAIQRELMGIDLQLVNSKNEMKRPNCFYLLRGEPSKKFFYFNRHNILIEKKIDSPSYVELSKSIEQHNEKGKLESILHPKNYNLLSINLPEKHDINELLKEQKITETTLFIVKDSNNPGANELDFDSEEVYTKSKKNGFANQRAVPNNSYLICKINLDRDPYADIYYVDLAGKKILCQERIAIVPNINYEMIINGFHKENQYKVFLANKNKEFHFVSTFDNSALTSFLRGNKTKEAKKELNKILLLDAHYHKNILIRYFQQIISYHEYLNLEKRIAPVIDYFINRDTLYLVTPLGVMNGAEVVSKLNNPNLSEELKISILIHFTQDMLTAYEYLQERGFIHQDLKLPNVVLTPDGHFMLIDAGESKSLAKYDEFHYGFFQELLNEFYYKGDVNTKAPEIQDKSRTALIDFVNENKDTLKKLLLVKDAWAIGLMLLSMWLGEVNPLTPKPDDVHYLKKNNAWRATAESNRTSTFDEFDDIVKNKIEQKNILDVSHSEAITSYQSVMRNLLKVSNLEKDGIPKRFFDKDSFQRFQKQQDTAVLPPKQCVSELVSAENPYPDDAPSLNISSSNINTTDSLQMNTSHMSHDISSSNQNNTALLYFGGNHTIFSTSTVNKDTYGSDKTEDQTDLYQNEKTIYF